MQHCELFSGYSTAEHRHPKLIIWPITDTDRASNALFFMYMGQRQRIVIQSGAQR